MEMKFYMGKKILKILVWF